MRREKKTQGRHAAIVRQRGVKFLNVILMLEGKMTGLDRIDKVDRMHKVDRIDRMRADGYGGRGASGKRRESKRKNGNEWFEISGNLNLVMVARLQEVNAVIPNKVNDAMLVGQPSRPGPGGQVFSGSGLPMPSNGSRRMASIKSITRMASLRSVSTQKRRSSMNSGWKTAARSFLLKVDFAAQVVQG